MKLPEEPKKRKEIANKMIIEITTDQMKVVFSNLDPNKDTFLKDTIDYFDSVSRQVFDIFVCEFGFAMNKIDLFNSILFLNNDLYSYYKKTFVKDKRISIWLNNEEIKTEEKEKILNIVENSLFLYLCNSLFELKNKFDKEKKDEYGTQFENLACIIAILMRINTNFIPVYGNAIMAQCIKYGKEMKEEKIDISSEAIRIFQKDLHSFYVNLMERQN